MTSGLDSFIQSFIGTSSGAGSIFIPASKAAAFANQSGLSVPAFLMALLDGAAGFSRPAISKFPVGAVAMSFPMSATTNGFGDVYLGASFEVRAESLTVVVHGEQSAIQNAFSHGATGLQYLAISAPPCGYCRQFIWEVTDQPQEIAVILADTTAPDGYTIYKMSDLLPVAFGPSELHKSRSLLVPRNNGIAAKSNDPLATLAIDGANTCYSPYTDTYSAIALSTSDGTTAVGRYAENVAYNPSMVPMMSAFSQLNLTLPMGAAMDVTAAVMVQRKTDVDMRPLSEAILAALCPGVSLTVVSI